MSINAAHHHLLRSGKGDIKAVTSELSKAGVAMLMLTTFQERDAGSGNGINHLHEELLALANSGTNAPADPQSAKTC